MTSSNAALVLGTPVSRQQPTLELLKPKPLQASNKVLRATFWIFGTLLVSAQAWINRYQVAADSISYFDMSDGVLRGGDWHRLINGMYSGLYPVLLGTFRRLFNISPGNEIAASHLFGVVLFLFAFACFEFFLAGACIKLESQTRIFQEDRSSVPLPKWAFLSIAYTVFLWSAISHIQVVVPRADMLLSGFFFLALGLVLRIDGAARWASYLTLGTILGIGILAKEAMLPIGILILASTLFLVKNWRPAVKMAAGALALMLLIGSLYFVPLSVKEGRITLGEAGKCVYLTNVDQVSPHWYLQTPGSAEGSFLHPPKKIFSDPPAYAFATPDGVTEPLRFDQSYWMAGVRPHFVWHRQITTLKTNVRTFSKLLVELRFVLGAMLVLAFLSGSRKRIVHALTQAWAVWLIGIVGCLMYAAVWVEPRYVTAFLTLCCVGLLVGLPIPAAGRKLAHSVAIFAVIACVALLLFSVASGVYRSRASRANVALDAARSLQNLGIRAGDQVARISPSSADLVVERILRVQIAAEVDHDHTADFWNSSPSTQEAVLQAFAVQGVKAVVATSPVLNANNQSEWIPLGSTPYWVWLPANHHGKA